MEGKVSGLAPVVWKQLAASVHLLLGLSFVINPIVGVIYPLDLLL